MRGASTAGPAIGTRPTVQGGHAVQWVSWMVGAAVLGVVIATALHVAEEREFARLLERANLWWLWAAALLQAATYAAQAEVFRGAPRAAGIALPSRWLYGLSLSKLFLDQALPSGGVSSTVVVSQALAGRGVPRAAVAACAVINIASYHAAYVALLVVALAITAGLGHGSVLVVLVSVLFVAFAIGVTVAVLTLAGRDTRPPRRLARLPIVAGVIGFLNDADPSLTRDARLLGGALAWQATIFLLDTATMWVILRSVAAPAPPGAVFASFMISSLFRTMGIVPGGLGTYEATSVLTLKMLGVPVAAALSATLIFRGFSFWLPMIPGLWVSRRLGGGHRDPRATRSSPR
jgi:Mg2+-importing ATPase